MEISLGGVCGRNPDQARDALPARLAAYKLWFNRNVRNASLFVEQIEDQFTRAFADFVGNQRADED